MPGGKRLATALLAIGIQAPLRGETIQKETTTTVEAQPLTMDEAVSRLQDTHFELHTENGRVALVVDSGLEPANQLDLGAMQHIEFDPGVTGSLETTMAMDWAGRSFEQGAKPKEGVREKAMAQARTHAEALLQKFTELGIDPNAVIEKVTVHSIGSSSAEGPAAENAAVAEQRGELGARSIGQAFLESGVDKDKIDISWEGAGEQGSLDEFSSALANAGINATNVEELIRGVHNGSEQRPEVLAAYQEHLASHRSAHVRVVIEQMPVDIYIQPGQEEAREIITRIVKEWGRVETYNGPEQDVEVEQRPLPGNVPPNDNRVNQGAPTAGTVSEPPTPRHATDSRQRGRGRLPTEGMPTPIPVGATGPRERGVPPTPEPGGIPIPPDRGPIGAPEGEPPIDGGPPLPPGPEIGGPIRPGNGGIEAPPPRTRGETTGGTIDNPPPPPPPPPPYDKSLRTALNNKPLPPQSRTPQQRQYATGLGSAKGHSIGRAPSRQSFKGAARKHHTGKR